MIEITKDSINYGEYVDNHYKKNIKKELLKKIFNKNKTLTYLISVFFIFAIANLMLIYNFFILLGKIN